LKLGEIRRLRQLIPIALADKRHIKEGHAHLRPSAAEADSAGANKLRPRFDATPDGFQGIQGQRTLLPSDWKESVFGRIMKRVDTSPYWDGWSADIAIVADRYIHSFAHLLEDAERQDPFQEFVGTLHQTLNPSADNESAVEMLAQHILVKQLFDAMLPDHSFSQQNPLSRAMNTLLACWPPTRCSRTSAAIWTPSTRRWWNVSRPCTP